MKLYAALILLTLLASGCAVTPATHAPAESFAGGWTEKAMFEAREQYAGVENNCLQVARAAQARLKQVGIGTQLLVLDLNERLNHAIVCTEDGQCLDNGYLSLGLFAAGELERYNVVFRLPTSTLVAAN